MQPLSYSKISTYLTCPLNYKFQYVDKLPRKPKHYFSFGNTMHRCAQYFFQKERKGPPSLDDLLSYFEKTWTSAGYRTAEQEEADKELGREILTKFWEINSRDYHPALATEQWFVIDIDGVRFRGYIDKVDISPNGGLIIIDYKSGKAEITRDQVENSLQLSLYQLGVGGLWLLPVEKLSLYHLRSNSMVDVGPRDQRTLDETRETVHTVAESIKEEKFEPRLNYSCPCDYAQFCPLFNREASVAGSSG